MNHWIRYLVVASYLATSSCLGITDINKNELTGTEIPILMYHRITLSPTRDPYTISSQDFKHHLHEMRANKFQPISLDDAVNNNFSRVRIGWKPYIITFDDATHGQFALEKPVTHPIKPHPQCAVGILEEFKKIEPTTTATFYISFVGGFFGDKSTFPLKMEYLINHGYTIGSHSWSHFSALQTSTTIMIEDIQKSLNELEKYAGKGKVRHFAWPYGDVPYNNQQLLKYVNTMFITSTLAQKSNAARFPFNQTTYLSRILCTSELKTKSTMRSIFANNNLLQRVS